MRSRYNRVRIWGIRLRLHYSWFLGFVWITAIIVTQFPEVYSPFQKILLGIAASLFYFLALSIREIALNLLAISKGLPAKRITMFVFGGVSPVTQETTTPSLEFLLAAVGLLSNLIIAALFYGAHSLLVNTDNILLDGIIQWMAFIYVMLTLLHFIPVLPLDCGRLVRALGWKFSGSYRKATYIISLAGQCIGLIMITSGIILMILSQMFNGISLIFIGWALHSAAVFSRQQVMTYQGFQGITAKDVMARECPIINQQLSIGDLIRNCIVITGQRSFAVADNSDLKGVVSMRNLNKVHKSRWSSTQVNEVMTPASKLVTAQSEQSAASIFEQMDELGIEEMPVLENNKVIGIVLRDNLIRLYRTRTILKV